MISRGTMMALLIGITVGLSIPYILFLHSQYLIGQDQCIETGRSEASQFNIPLVPSLSDNSSLESLNEYDHNLRKLSIKPEKSNDANYPCSSFSNGKPEQKILPRKILIVYWSHNCKKVS